MEAEPKSWLAGLIESSGRGGSLSPPPPFFFFLHFFAADALPLPFLHFFFANAAGAEASTATLPPGAASAAAIRIARSPIPPLATREVLRSPGANSILVFQAS